MKKRKNATLELHPIAEASLKDLDIDNASDNHPVQRAIWEACLRKLSAAMKLLQASSLDLSAVIPPLEEVAELSSYLVPRSKGIAPFDEVAQALLKAGHPISKILQVEHDWKRPRRGAPTKTHLLAVSALELKTLKPQTSWRMIAGSLCPCGAERNKHTPACSQRIRQAVRLLQKTLKRYSVRIGDKTPPNPSPL